MIEVGSVNYMQLRLGKKIQQEIALPQSPDGVLDLVVIKVENSLLENRIMRFSFTFRFLGDIIR